MDMTTEERLAAIETELQDLLDRQAIYDCIKRTSRGNDRFDKELIVGSYHDDGVHELGTRQISGQEYGDHANHSHGAICEVNLHNITMHSCEIDGDVAHAESYVIGLFTDKGAEMSRILAGRYIDRLEKRNGEWRIALRRATVEVALEGAAKLPNGLNPPGTGYLKGNRDRSDPSYERPLSLKTGARW
jgi:SnoaL-like domain